MTLAARGEGEQEVGMINWQPIETLPGASRDEILVVLRDGKVRTAARGLGTILLGPYGQAASADNWPVKWAALPEYTAHPTGDDR